MSSGSGKSDVWAASKATTEPSECPSSTRVSGVSKACTRANTCSRNCIIAEVARHLCERSHDEAGRETHAERGEPADAARLLGALRAAARAPCSSDVVCCSCARSWLAARRLFSSADLEAARAIHSRANWSARACSGRESSSGSRPCWPPLRRGLRRTPSLHRSRQAPTSGAITMSEIISRGLREDQGDSSAVG